MVKVSDLRLLEVVNIVDGKKLGLASDLEIDLESGMVKAIVIPGTSKFLGIFGRENDVVIPWKNIKKIGVDVILVELNNFTNIIPVSATQKEES